jgi:hypothetical protein
MLSRFVGKLYDKNGMSFRFVGKLYDKNGMSFRFVGKLYNKNGMSFRFVGKLYDKKYIKKCIYFLICAYDGSRKKCIFVKKQ